MAIEKFDHPLAREGGDFVFVDTDHEPPKYALVAFDSENDNGQPFYTLGPMYKGQLDIHLLPIDEPLTEEQNAIVSRPSSPFGAEVAEGYIDASYPGGREGAARRIAKFVFGVD